MTVKIYENMAHFKDIMESSKLKTVRSILQC
jgi:hypothetical protein